MKILVPTALDVEVPQAPVARLRTLQRGMERTGSGRLAILSVGPTSRSGQSQFPRTRLGRSLRSLTWRVGAVRAFRKVAMGDSRPDAVLLVDLDPLLLAGLIRAAARLRIPTYVEITEFPEVIGGGRFWRVRSTAYWRSLRRVQGVLPITRVLQREAQRHLRSPTLLVPGYVDPWEFQAQRDEGGGCTVTYAGSLSETKDGVLNLVHAFAQARSQVASMRLRILAGGYSSDEKARLARVIVELELQEYVSVEGPYPRAEIPKLLCEASILVLPRPRTKQASGGFPTKLGEYLATGRPVVATSVGPIPGVVQDGVSAILVPPDDRSELTRALVRLGQSSELRAEVGQGGRVVAETTLNVDEHAQRVVAFMQKVSGHGSR